MNTLDYVALLLAITASFAYANHYLLRLPRNSGLLVIALITSLALRGFEYALPQIGLGELLRNELAKADLGPLLLNGFLGFLLFAGALDVDVKQLLSRKWTILTLATVGVLLSTFAMGAGIFGIFRLVGLNVPLSYCFVFGALISPTDPVTVLEVLRRLGVPKRLQAVIAGESMFNDGAGIVLFTILLEWATGGPELSFTAAFRDFVREAGGGAALGLAAGGAAFVAMRGIDEYNIELMISLALVSGTYGAAQTLHVSGPVAVVVAGLLMGSVGVQYAVSGTTHDYLHKFWSLAEELLNALLFLLLGLEFAAVDLQWPLVIAALLAVPLMLLVRATSSTVASLPLNLYASNKLRAIGLLTWSGLRGGISVALALSIPTDAYRAPLITATYGIVIFTMVAQGLTLGSVARHLFPKRETPEPTDSDYRPPPERRTSG